MRYNVATTEIFEQYAKKLLKKYPSLKRELDDLIEELEETPTLGKALADILLQNPTFNRF